MRRGHIIMTLAGLIAGCSGTPGQRSVSDPDPSNKIPAMRQAAQAHDQCVVGPLVDSLESDDPAVRFYAISALCRLTGEDFGYSYYADEMQRRPAVERWRQWFAAQTVPTTAPAE